MNNARKWHDMLMDAFPALEYACAYGSAVFPQGSRHCQSNHRPMIDFIFSVNDAISWHDRNLRTNPHHYSTLLRYVGAKHIVRLQQWGGGIYYNTHVKLSDDAHIKYGVISSDDLCEDLCNWHHIYVGGRMHKPVLPIVEKNERIVEAQQMNLRHALRVSLLLLPEDFTYRDLFARICGLSYLGDVRVGTWEHPKKVVNIVDNNFEAFLRLYEEPLSEAMTDGILEFEECSGGGGGDTDADVRNAKLRQTSDPQKRALLLWERLPLELQCKTHDIEGLRNCIQRIVSRSSLRQTAKGLLTAGFVNSFSYAQNKYARARRR